MRKTSSWVVFLRIFSRDPHDGSGNLVNPVLPADISRYESMRAMNEPIMILFCFSPFIVAFAAVVVFDLVDGGLE
jgi:hypothetical protein